MFSAKEESATPGSSRNNIVTSSLQSDASARSFAFTTTAVRRYSIIGDASPMMSHISRKCVVTIIFGTHSLDAMYSTMAVKSAHPSSARVLVPNSSMRHSDRRVAL